MQPLRITQSPQDLYRSFLQEQLHIAWHIWRVYFRELTGRKYEPEVKYMDRFLPVNATVIQIGASDGRHAFYMARKLNCEMIICFEPSPYTYKILNVLKWLFRFNQIKTENLAVGLTPGESYLVTPVKRSGHLGLAFAFVSDVSPDPETIDPARGFDGYLVKPVTMTSIDEYCNQNSIQKLDFIRCDVEGSELNVLRGARNSLKRFRPVLLLEVHPHILKNTFGASAQEVWSELEQLDYRMYYLKDNNLEFTTKFKDEPWRDYFCVPEERIAAFGLLTTRKQ